ncbi:peroxiredoxin family protein [Chloroflexota bacterium]
MMRFLRENGCLSFRRETVVLFMIAMLGLLLIQACAPSSQAMQDGQQEATVGIKVGEIAPDFTLLDLDGNEVKLSEFLGKRVFINFWATWCPPCRAEMPDIESLYQEYKDKGLVVIGIDISESEGTTRQFVQRGGYGWTFVLDSTGAVAANYNVRAIPTSFFIDREGVIQAVNIGAITKRRMEANIAEAIISGGDQ